MPSPWLGSAKRSMPERKIHPGHPRLTASFQGTLPGYVEATICTRPDLRSGAGRGPRPRPVEASYDRSRYRLDASSGSLAHVLPADP